MKLNYHFKKCAFLNIHFCWEPSIKPKEIQHLNWIFLEKRCTRTGFQYRHFQGSGLENQLHNTSNIQSVCLAYVLISPQIQS